MAACVRNACTDETVVDTFMPTPFHWDKAAPSLQCTHFEEVRSLSSQFEDARIVDIQGTALSMAQVTAVARWSEVEVQLNEGVAQDRVSRSANWVAENIACGRDIYGVTTGFGATSNRRTTETSDLQTELIRFLNAGVIGRENLSPSYAKAAMLVRANTLMQGYSGIWWEILNAMAKLMNRNLIPKEKNETAISSWSRAGTKAAKVGKGLLKNDRAQKLASQHWPEAIDPRHRYGHNLHFYYVKWLNCQSREHFFYWLDIGEGKEVNLVDNCPRSKLQQQCIKYLSPNERKAYEVMVEDGKFLYRQSRDLLHTIDEPMDTKWIFVLSTSKTLYVGKKKKGEFQHSSFLAGGATSAAGRLVVENGSLKAVWPHSGHYRPTQENFNEFISFLKENDVDITNVKMSPLDDEESFTCRQRSSVHVRNDSSRLDIMQSVQVLGTDKIDVQNLTQDLMEEETVAGKSRLMMKYQQMANCPEDLGMAT